MIEKAAYAVQEVATLTRWSRQTVTRLFENERGVPARLISGATAACIPLAENKPRDR
jgi:hypothetical protein